MQTFEQTDTMLPTLGKASLPDLGSKYQVLEIIGGGGMGIVLKARHRTLSQIRAVKLLRTDLSDLRPAVLARFRREAMIASDLSHPNIVRVFDFDIAPDGAPFIVMEYLDGESVDSLLQRQRRISLARTVEILHDVARALDAVHQTGVVHRDLKPANIFITKEGPVKILDFGISHIEHSPSRITKEGEVVGTLLYMAPEQLQKQPLSPRADIFSLGAAALEMLTEKPIVETSDIRVLTYRMMDEAPFFTQKDLGELPPHAAKALCRALSKNPAERYATATAFVRSLRGESVPDDHSNEKDPPPILSRFDAYAASVIDTNEMATNPTALKRAHLREWIVLIFLMVIIAGLVLLFHPDVRARLFGAPRAVNFLVMPGTLKVDEGRGTEPPASMVSRLIAEYMNVDPRASAIVFDAAAAEYPAAEYSRLTYSLAGRPGHYTLSLSTENLPDTHTAWKLTTEGVSIETVVESATARLASEALPSHLPPNTDASCIEDDEESCIGEIIAENALVRGLFPRVQRTLNGPLAAEGRAFAPYVYRFIQCADTLRPDRCREALALPIVNSNARRRFLDALKKDRTLATDPQGLCRLTQSDDPLVRAAAQSVQAPGCDDTAPICGKMDTLFDRLACLRASEQVDAPETTRRYFEDIVETDMYHFLVLSGFSSLYNAPFENADKKRFNRMLQRFFDRPKDISLSAFRFYMTARDGVESLIWARRCKAPGYFEGLALMADGWLKAGVTKSIAAVLDAGISNSSDTRAEQVRASVQPILITKSAEMANAWLSAAENRTQGDPMLKAVTLLVSAVAKGDRSICDESIFFPLFEPERLYLCADFEGLLRDFGKMAGAMKGIRGRALEFYLGEALLNQGRIDAASALFQMIEQDPFIRSAYPVAAVEAAARLGRIAEGSGEWAEAARHYRAYLHIWPGLDVPLPSHIEVEKNLARVERRLEH